MSRVRPFIKKAKRPLGIAIGIGNHKGGVGKSTNAVHIAAGLGQKGYSCLLLDLDPTAGTTRLLGLTSEEYAGTLELLTEENDLESLLIEEDLPSGVSLIPSRTDLSELDSMLSRYADKLRLLEAPLSIARQKFDYIIVDTPPQPGSTLLAAAYASLEWFLLSVHAEPLAVAGLGETLKDIADVRKHLNRRLEVLGVVIGRVKRNSKYWKEIAGFIDEVMPGRGFDVQLSDTVQIQRASAEGITAFDHPRLSRQRIANEYRELVSEIEARTTQRGNFLEKTKRNRSRGKSKSARRHAANE